MTLTYDAGATSTMEVASGRAAYMARQTVQNLGVRQPNNALAQYYADSVDQQQAATPEPQSDEAPKLDRVARPPDRSKRTLDELDAALRANMGGLAEALLGKPTRKTPNEMRWGSKGAFQVSLRGPSRGAWKDHESGEGGGPLGLIVRARGGSMRDAIEWGYKWAGIDPNAPEPIVQIQRPTKADQGAEAEAYRLQRMALAQRMWKESVPIQGTTAERYLVEARGVPKQLFGWPASYRYHPQSNALIVGLTDAAGEVRAVQRVMLDQEGKKAMVEVQKPTTGRMEGLAVRLAGDPKGPLVIAEGPETGISVWSATGYETLVAVSGSWRMSDLPTDRRVVIARDDDPVGSPAWTAILRASREWKANGIDVHFVRPWQHSRGDKSDFNDLLKQGGVGAVRARFNPDNVVRMDAADMPQRGAVLRPDTHPKLLRLLEINQKFALSETEIAHLMNATTITGREIEGKTYSTYKERLKDGTTYSVPLGYIDLTWSAHKSVSLAWAFAVSDLQRDTILRAWRDAVAKSMVYAENVLGVVAKGDGRNGGYDQGHVTWVSFDHYTARPTVDIVEVAADGSKHTDSVKVNLPGDPNLHTHAIMPNVVLADNGRVGSLDGDRLDGKVKQLGAYLQAQLATNLRKYGGIEVDVDPDTFSARIAAIPSLANTTFSKRTNKSEVVAKEFAAAHGLDWSTMTPEARTNLVHKSAGITKQRKAADAKIDFDSWHAQADAIHWRPSNVLRPGQEIGVPELAARIEGAYTASLPWLDAAFRHRAVLTEDEVRTIATRGLIVTGITDWKDVDRVTKLYRERGVLHNEKPTNLVWAPNPENQWRMAITTELHEAEETELIALVREAHADTRGSNRTDLKQLKQFADASGLDFTTPEGKEQYAAAVKLASGGKFSLVIGVPGSGKSAVLKPLVNSWNADGKNVVGLALAWRQTEQLESAGIKYRKAIDAFLRKPDAANLSPNTVVVIDEIGQVCTHQLLQIARLQKEIGFSVVALGDPRQCQSIEAGPVIDLLRRALGEANVPTLLKIIRQLTDREKTISKLFRDGDAATAIQMKREDNTARNIPGSYTDVVKHVANLWAELTVANKATKDYRLTVMAPTNGEAHDISREIREKRREWGEIGPDLKVIPASDQRGKVRYDLSIAAGDKVRLFERTNASFVTGGHGNIGHNGSVLTVVGASDEDITLKDRDGREGRVKWSTLKETGVVRLAYGDALTIDAGQGMTGTEHIDAMVGGSSAVSAFKATVTESRHRVRSHMIVSDVAERRQIIGRRPTGDPRPITEEDVWANVARNLSRAPAQEAATAMIARLHEVKRSTAHVVQATQTLEQLRPGRWPKMQIRNALARAATMVQTVVHRQGRSQSL